MTRIGIVAAVAIYLALVMSMPLYAQQQTYPQQPVYNSAQQSSQLGTSVIPAGTTIAIRTNENIKTSQAQPGSSYSAEIAEDVMSPNGQILIPRGSPAQLSVVSTGKSTLGGNDLALALRSVSVNGRTYTVTTNTSSGGAGGTGIGANKRTAEHVGGGVLLGTLLGAIAGGGKGAAVGAILGGGAGAAAQVLTKGREINVPAESVLRFRLDQPTQLT
ncbi:MAG TPA: hypothetical protein VE734_10365 [Terriglobales bacterium]|jgi:hypothetical protein|nr:hypothetical protein [Terriglobales bacterium]